MAEIEILRFYRCRIAFEASYDDQQKIENKGFHWGSKMEIESFSGNAACHPYIEAETQSMEDISEWRNKIIRYINRFKSVRLL